jgi:hypothetical protein
MRRIRESFTTGVVDIAEAKTKNQKIHPKMDKTIEAISVGQKIRQKEIFTDDIAFNFEQKYNT